jgi:hypothetical protein
MVGNGPVNQPDFAACVRRNKCTIHAVDDASEIKARARRVQRIAVEQMQRIALVPVTDNVSIEIAIGCFRAFAMDGSAIKSVLAALASAPSN